MPSKWREATTLDQLILAAERLLRGLRDPDVEAFLASWPVPPWQRRDAAPRGLPVLHWLADACAGGGPETLAEMVPEMVPEIGKVLAALQTAAPRLAWAQTYTAADRDAAFLDRYGWTELIGARGPVASPELAVGFLLLGPHTTYPAHHHVAEEIYLPLSGTATWQRGTEPARPRPPGRPIRHASREPHAMRTGHAPLLALYLWRGGDLAEKSRFA